MHDYFDHRDMNRPIALLLFALILGLVIVEAATEQNGVSGSIDQQKLAVHLTAQILLTVGLFMYCGFAALHSTQRIDSPQERTVWLIAIITLNVLGSCWYYMTTYQKFRKAGQGWLMRFRKVDHAQVPR